MVGQESGVVMKDGVLYWVGFHLLTVSVVVLLCLRSKAPGCQKEV